MLFRPTSPRRLSPVALSRASAERKRSRCARRDESFGRDVEARFVDGLGSRSKYPGGGAEIGPRIRKYFPAHRRLFQERTRAFEFAKLLMSLPPLKERLVSPRGSAYATPHSALIAGAIRRAIPFPIRGFSGLRAAEFV